MAQFVLTKPPKSTLQEPLNKKNLHIETLRGLAIILVVFGHIIGSGDSGGLRVNNDSLLRYIYYSLEYIRMPLFTVISGWVYANKPLVNRNDRGKFIKGKTRRLLLPMFVISTILFLSRAFIPGTNFTPSLSELPLNLIFPYDLYWYLYSLFLIFLLIITIDTTTWFHQFKYWLLSLAVALFISLIAHRYFDVGPNFFSYKGALFLLPYFFLGIGFYRYKSILLRKEIIYWIGTIFFVAILFQQVIWFWDIDHLPKQSLLGFAVGAGGTFLLFKLNFKNKLLINIGNYAYTIYLFHIFFTGGTRIILYALGINNTFVIIVLSLILAIGIPIVIDFILRKARILRLLFLGLK